MLASSSCVAPAAFALSFVLIGSGRAAEDYLPSRITRIWGPLKPAEKGHDRLLAKLHMGGKYPYIDEWVFNGAEIPGAPVVFARLVNPASDERLVRSMPGYEILRVNAQTGELTWPKGRHREGFRQRQQVFRALITA